MRREERDMFQESAKKRSVGQIIGIVCVFVLALLIVCTFVLYGIFKDANTAPSIFGHRIYIMNGDGMEPRIEQGAAVFVDEGVMPEAPGNVILCSIDGRLAVVGYVGSQEVTLPDGTVESRYIVKYDNTPEDEVWAVEASDIIGRAVSYDVFLGALIRFVASKAGMLIIVIVPCAALVIYEVVMLILSLKKGKKAAAAQADSSELDYEIPDFLKDDYAGEESSSKKAKKAYAEHEPAASGSEPAVPGSEPAMSGSEPAMSGSEPLRFKSGNKEKPAAKHADGEKNPFGFGNGSVNISSGSLRAEREAAAQPKPKPAPAFTSSQTDSMPPIRKADHTIPEDAYQHSEADHEAAPAVTPNAAAFEKVYEQTHREEPQPAHDDSAGTSSSAASSGDLLGSGSVSSRMDELMKLLEEEKKKLSGN